MADPDLPLPNLTVQQLEYLEAAVRAPTWAAAAVELGVSPSALSQGLAELERRLGLTLFEPAGRRRVPTDSGRVVVSHAQRVLAATRDLARWADTARAGRSGRLRVGMIDAAAIDRYPDVLRAFRQGRPDLDLHLAVAPSGELLAQLERGALDLAVVVEPLAAPRGIELHTLAEEPLAVYAPDGARVGEPRRWGPWVLFPVGSHTRSVVEQALRALGAPVEVVAESHQPEVLREMVRLGLGWTVLPENQAERPPAPLRRARRSALVTRRLAVARRADALPHPAAAELAAALRTSSRAAR
ncbi:MAG: LysR family transcriptional regulator [Acidimicrobiales bacterium]|nr:LysR family transcriptional regulator [Acidimicrobiales bacterium]